MKITTIVLLCATAVAAAQPHRHGHRHAKKHGSPIDKRADVTKVVEGPTVTEYMLDGKIIPAGEVTEGLKDGLYVLVSESTTTTAVATTSVSPITTTTSIKPTATKAAEFIQKISSSSSVPAVPTTSSAPPPPSSTSTQAPVLPTTVAAPVKSSSNSVSAGINSEFPSGTIKCSEFPSAYGPVAVDWLGLNGYTGVQQVPGFSPLVDSVISLIETAVYGSSCVPNSYCSYACPAGYHKMQWPPAQGKTGQSIGGLFCNKQGYLELSSDSSKVLCGKGVAGVKIQNKLSGNAALCGTDYPGTESETIPLNTLPGNTYDVTCPDASTYYRWQGSFTSGQYYLNNKNVGVSDACQWGSAPSGSDGPWQGNWAPMNLGVGKGITGEIFLSMFPNTPTNPLSVQLNHNVEITGDVSAVCKYVSGTYYMNGSPSAQGCTVSCSGQCTFVLTDA